MTTTPFLGLSTFSTASGSATTFLDFRLALADASSNMSKIDGFSSSTSASLIILQANAWNYVIASYISPNYYTANSSGISYYYTGMFINLSLNTTNDGTTTLNINSLGVQPVRKIDRTGTVAEFVSGELIAHRNYLFTYDGTQFVLMGSTTIDQLTASGSVGNFINISSASTLQDSGVPILTGVTTGSFNKVMVDSYGRVTSASVVPIPATITATTGSALSAYSATTGSFSLMSVLTSIAGSAIMTATTGSVVKHNVSGVISGSYNKIITDIYGHITAGSSIDVLTAISGSNIMSSTTGSVVKHNISGITSGSYSIVRVDDYGHVTSGSTIDGYTGTITFYASSSSGGSTDVLNTIGINKGIITSWSQV